MLTGPLQKVSLAPSSVTQRPSFEARAVDVLHFYGIILRIQIWQGIDPPAGLFHQHTHALGVLRAQSEIDPI